MHRILMSITGISTLVAVLTAANLRHGPESVTIDWRVIRQRPIEVVAEPPSRGTIVQTVVAPGTVEPVVEAEIASQIVGRVVAVPVEEGDIVAAGDLLVKLDDTEARANRDSAIARIERSRAAIAQAEADLQKANRDLRQSQLLLERGAATPRELADAVSVQARAVAALEIGRNELSEAEAMRRTSEQLLDRTEIRSPIDGVVANLDVAVGEVVIAGTVNLPGTVMMTVGDPERMRVRVEVEETDRPLVRPGQPARVYLQASPATPIEGTVESVAPSGKEVDGVVIFETLVRIDATDAFVQPRMTATVEVEVSRAEDAEGVPVQAVVQRRRRDLPDTPEIRSWSERHAQAPGVTAGDADLQYVQIVFVAAGGVARARPVETGRDDERRVEILSGLAPTDLVIVGPFRALDALKDGSPIARIAPGAGDEGDRP